MLSISEFASRVKLTTSALRYYDDCGILQPAHVEASTGYRYYLESQERRAVLIRRLRDIGVPLAEVGRVLDGSPAEARATLTQHLAELEAKAAATRAAVASILRFLDPGEEEGCTVVLSGPELASAIRQVLPAADPKSLNPSFRCMLLEIGVDEVCCAATDTYRLSVRTLRPTSFCGEASAVLIPIQAVNELRSWIAQAESVTVELREGVLQFASGEDRRTVPTETGGVYDHRALVAGLAPVATRIAVDRLALIAAIADDRLGPIVRLTTTDDALIVSSSDESESARLSALCSGPIVRFAFSARQLAECLETSVGPDILLELVSTNPQHPVVVRSADQGTFTTLLMPIALDHG